jgi:hypothetical protein
VNKGRQQRVQKPKSRHAHSDAVNDERACEVLHDDPATAPGDPQRFDEFREITSNQNDVGALSSDSTWLGLT